MSDPTPPISVAAGTTTGEFVARTGDRVDRLYAIQRAGTTWVFHEDHVYELLADAGARRRGRGAHQHGELTAPMPATVVAINVKAGDAVTRGDILIVLEAMKMELPVRAEGDATVSAIHCAAGDLVQPGVALIELD